MGFSTGSENDEEAVGIYVRKRLRGGQGRVGLGRSVGTG